MNIEQTNNAGIKCDNPECDFTKYKTPDERLAEWLNVPCPKCGHNLLTQTDLDLSIKVHEAMDFINSLTEAQIIELNEALGVDVESFKNISNEFTVDIHNGVNLEFKEKE